MDIDWYYVHLKGHLSMMSYVTEALTRLQHNNLRKLPHQPYPHIKPTYGAKAQYLEAADVSPSLIKADKNLYYAWAVNPTMLTALG